VALYIIVINLIIACNPTTPKVESIGDSPILKKESSWDSSHEEKIDSLLTQALKDSIIPGAVALISVEGDIVYKKAVGYAQLYGYRKKLISTPEVMTTEHVFDLASLTKVLATTMGIMKLVDQGNLELDIGIGNYLSEFKNSEKGVITIRQLLTHTSGLYPWKPLYYHADNAALTLEYIASLPLGYPIGAERHYSDLGFMLLGYIIERVSGQGLNEFVKEEIYNPLRAEHSTYLPSDPSWRFAATSHGNPYEYKMVADDDFGFDCDERVDDFNGWRNYTLIGEVNDGNSYYANEGVAGHAGLFSTADDIYKMLSVLLNEGANSNTRPFSKSVVTDFLTVDTFGNGLGWAMSTDVLPVTVLPEGGFGHTGFTGTSILCLPETKTTIILLTNRQNLDVYPSGRYPSVTKLRKSIHDYVISELQ